MTSPSKEVPSEEAIDYEMRRTLRRMNARQSSDPTTQGAVCSLPQGEKENLNLAEPGS
jgi:hypothetical protein